MIDAIRGHVSISGACVGPIVGLVAVTPACGFIQPGWALLIGIIATGIIYGLLILKRYTRFDDTLDVAIVHGCGKIRLAQDSQLSLMMLFSSLGGIAGAFMTGLFAEQSMNPTGGVDGAFYGRPIQMWYQIVGILTAIGKLTSLPGEAAAGRRRVNIRVRVIGFGAVCTAGILLPLHFIMGIRLAREDELQGLDAASKPLLLLSKNRRARIVRL